MFGRKKKKQASLNVLDDTRTVVDDFKRRVPIEGHRIVEYRMYHKLEEEEMLPKLDAHLEALFAGRVDCANANMLDNIIIGSAREAVSDLRRQRCIHSDLLRRLIARRKADREDFGRIVEERKRELAELQQGYEKTCRMLAKDSGEEDRYE